MIKHIKDILMEGKAPDILIPRRTEGRLERVIQQYIKNGNKGDLDLSDMNLTKFPDVLKYVKSVGGSFSCNGNELISLEGAPISVGGYFDCCDNQLTSLKGAPQSVGGGFHCRSNQLTSLVGAPKSVGGDFDCGDNPVDNPVEFTREQVRALCHVKGQVYV